MAATLKYNADLTKNPRQIEFFNHVMMALAGITKDRYFFYGGGIRGGKSFVCAFIFLVLCKKYPNSRWHVIRATMPNLIDTVIPTFEKLVAGNPNFTWSRDRSNYFLRYTNPETKLTSHIFFVGQNIERDPNLVSFLGVETNGFWLEQMEEINEKMWQMAIQRTGSWYIDPMPPGMVFGTFNPTQEWVKEVIYEPWRNGELTTPYVFVRALPSDNPFVTDDQRAGWQNMDDRYIAQFIEGDWTNFIDTNNLWAFSFEPAKHIGKVEHDPEQMTYISFDFNRNPICCSIIQHYDKQIKVVETVKLPNSDIYKLCNYIKVNYADAELMVTGDASGNASSAMVKDNLNYYIIIRKELNLGQRQIMVPTINPRLEDNQVLVNSLLSKYDVVMDKEKANPLIYDMQNVQMLPDGSIDKASREDPKKQADALDTFRYFCNTFMRGFIR